MCNFCSADCCCKNLSTDGLIKFLLTFTVINLVLSIVSIFIRAADTGRYDEALMYLEARNNGTYKNVKYTDCIKSGYLFKDDDYCKIDGEYLKKPSDDVSHQSLFKNWKTAELILSISRTLITVVLLAMVYFVIKNKAENINNMNQEQKEKYLGNFTYLLIFTAFMIFLSALYILIRALAIEANMQIGLYDDNDQNAFESNIAVNYIIDIIEIVLYGIEVCFILRLKRAIIAHFSTPLPVVNQNPPPPPQMLINVQQSGRRPQPYQAPQRIEVRQVRITQQLVSMQSFHPLDADYGNEQNRY